MTFAQAFTEFIAAYERDAQLQARCSAGESVDTAECVVLRFLLSEAGEALLNAASLPLPPEPRITFNQAFAAFIREYECLQRAQERHCAGENVDRAEYVERCVRVYRAVEALFESASLPLPDEPRR